MVDIAIAVTGSRQARGRLAMAADVVGLPPPPAGDDRPRVTIVLYIIAVVPGFFATNDPYQQNGARRLSSAASDPFHRYDASGGTGRSGPISIPTG